MDFKAIKRGTTDCYYGYYEILPDNYAGEKLPIIFAFGGIGQKGNGGADLYKALGAGLPYVIKQKNWQIPAIIIVPQNEGNWFNGNNSLGTNLVVDYCLKAYNVDLDRVYITGLSAGAYATWDYIKDFQGVVTAAMPIAGCGNDKYAHVIAKTPVRAFVNSGDSYYNNNLTITRLAKQAGGDIELTVGSGGHGGWNEVYSDYSNIEWLLSKTKAVTPVPEPEPIPDPVPVPELPILSTAEIDKFIQFLEAYKTTVKQ